MYITMMKVETAVVTAEKQTVVDSNRFMMSVALGPCNVIIHANETIPETDEIVRSDTFNMNGREAAYQRIKYSEGSELPPSSSYIHR
jgi:hypothetical protein